MSPETPAAGPDACGALFATDAIPVPLSSVEHVLTSLWKHQDVTKDSAQGVLTRACMSNLIIVCRAGDPAALASGEVDAIVCRHPSRVILLVVDPQPAAIAAEVSALCHLRGDRRQVCSEMVQVSAGGDEARKLPSVARSLVIGDLPTSLWWDAPSPPTLGGGLFDELKVMADQVIYSSLLWPDPVRGTLAVADWVAHLRPGDPVVMDVAWRALRPWRQLISQSLDPGTLPGAIDGLTGVAIEHGPHGLPQAWLLAGWVASALGWTPAARPVANRHEIAWRFRSRRGEVSLSVRRLDEGEPQVRRVQASWTRDGSPASLTFATVGPGHLGATATGFDAETRMLATPPLPRSSLVAAELQHLEPDRVFLDALLISRSLAADLSPR